MMKMKTLAALAAAFAVSAPAFAAETKTTLSDVLANSGVTVSGRAEAGYDYANTVGTADPAFGNFNKGNSFVLHQAALNLAKTSASGFGGAVTVLGGEDANVLSGEDVFLLQGYLSYAKGNLTVIGGRFLTLAGAEVIDASANFNATRGLLFFTQPTYHNGVRATYKVSDTLSFTGGLVNSVGPANTDGNDQKGVELNTILTLGTLTNSVTGYISDEDPAKGQGRVVLVDYVGTLPVTTATTLALNVDYYNVDTGSDKAKGWGVAGYVNHKLDAANRVALRAEYLHADELGFPANDLKAYTLTFGHAINSDFELLAEARLDHANNGSVAYPTEDSDTQYIGTIRGVYKF